MKKIFLLIITIISLTACTKPAEQIPESFVGQMRSKYPNIKISGISVNDKIICELKSSLWYNDYWLDCKNKWIHLYSETGSNTLNDSLIQIVEGISIEDGHTELYFSIPIGVIYDEKSVDCKLYNGENYRQSENVKTFRLKDFTFVQGENSEIVDCKIDAEFTLINGDVVEIVYYGKSINRPILGGIK